MFSDQPEEMPAIGAVVKTPSLWIEEYMQQWRSKVGDIPTQKTSHTKMHEGIVMKHDCEGGPKFIKMREENPCAEIKLDTLPFTKAMADHAQALNDAATEAGLGSTIFGENRGMCTLPNGVTVFYAENMKALDQYRGLKEDDVGLYRSGDYVHVHFWFLNKWNFASMCSDDALEKKLKGEDDTFHLEDRIAELEEELEMLRDCDKADMPENFLTLDSSDSFTHGQNVVTLMKDGTVRVKPATERRTIFVTDATSCGQAVEDLEGYLSDGDIVIDEDGDVGVVTCDGEDFQYVT